MNKTPHSVTADFMHSIQLYHHASIEIYKWCLDEENLDLSLLINEAHESLGHYNNLAPLIPIKLINYLTFMANGGVDHTSHVVNSIELKRLLTELLYRVETTTRNLCYAATVAKFHKSSKVFRNNLYEWSRNFELFLNTYDPNVVAVMSAKNEFFIDIVKEVPRSALHCKYCDLPPIEDDADI